MREAVGQLTTSMLLVWRQKYGKIKINRHLLYIIKFVKKKIDKILVTAITKASSFI